MVQGLELHASTAGGTSSIHGLGWSGNYDPISYSVQPKKKVEGGRSVLQRRE